MSEAASVSNRTFREPVGSDVAATVIARAKELAAGLKRHLQTARVPPPVGEVEYLLAESRRADRPLLERMRILGLLASSLDQFFATQFPEWQDGAFPPDAGFLADTSAHLEPLLQQAVEDLRQTLLPGLEAEYQIALGNPQELNSDQREFLRRFFHQQVYPLLTPLAVDPGHPFPFISSHSINLLVHLRSPARGARSAAVARIKVPRLLPRFVEVPHHQNLRLFMWSEDIVGSFLPELFPGMAIESAYLFRVLRAAHRGERDELAVQSHWLRNQQLASPVVRLEVEAAMPGRLLEWLAGHLSVSLQLCYHSPGPLAMFQLIDLANLAQAAD